MMLWAAIVGVSAGAAVRGDEPPKPKKNLNALTAPAPGMTKQPYLGIDLQPVPRSLASQLPGVLPKGQGVLVGFVEKESPADKAGLKTDDVLLTFDKKDVVSAEQLIQMVQEEKPGAKVAVGIVRGGKATTADVTVGERTAARMPADRPPMGFRLVPDDQFRKMFENGMGQNTPSGWESFDALNLARTGGDKWKAEVDYRNNDGKKEHKTFEGTRPEIEKAIRADKNLPAEERDNLIRVIDGKGMSFDFQFPWSEMFGPPAGGDQQQPKAPTPSSGSHRGS
jgi:hypothetical protein